MLIVEISELEGSAARRLEIDKPEITIGKRADCDVVLPSPKVSRQHARVFEKNGSLVLEDLKSTNGTSLNGEAVAGEHRLGDSDVIRIGGFEVRIERVTTKLAPPPAPAGATTAAPPGREAALEE